MISARLKSKVVMFNADRVIERLTAENLQLDLAWFNRLTGEKIGVYGFRRYRTSEEANEIINTAGDNWCGPHFLDDERMKISANESRISLLKEMRDWAKATRTLRIETDAFRLLSMFGGLQSPPRS